ncbi:MAG: hypothetical protein SF162_20175 [bacterium]|nr:hypothetical protein [bacterium]
MEGSLNGTAHVPGIFKGRSAVLVSVCSLSAAAFAWITLISFNAEMEQSLVHMRADVDALYAAREVPNGAMWSVGTGSGSAYHEWAAFYPESTLWPYAGAPSLRFTDHTSEAPDIQRDFEIGFYRYGPTWYSRHFITEFWLGSGDGGVLSVAGNEQGGGELQVRNPADSDSIMLRFTDANHPVIRTESGRALHFWAREGLVSETPHVFQDGIAFAHDGGYIGVVKSGWQQGAVRVTAPGVRAESLVFITPMSEPVGRWWVNDLEPGAGFTLNSTAPGETMQFQWMVIGSR